MMWESGDYKQEKERYRAFCLRHLYSVLSLQIVQRTTSTVPLMQKGLFASISLVLKIGAFNI